MNDTVSIQCRVLMTRQVGDGRGEEQQRQWLLHYDGKHWTLPGGVLPVNVIAKRFALAEFERQTGILLQGVTKPDAIETFDNGHAIVLLYTPVWYDEETRKRAMQQEPNAVFNPLNKWFTDKQMPPDVSPLLARI